MAGLAPAVPTPGMSGIVPGDDHVLAAVRTIRTQTMFLARTVLLEAEWVLRRRYRLDHGAGIDALGALISLANVRCEGEPIVRKALSRSRERFDFVDAVHLAASGAAEGFASFDRRLVKAAVSIEASMLVQEPRERGD
jgi:predicted nucleic-acid-binding protein